MKKILVFSILIFLLTNFLFCQNKNISEARAEISAGNFKKAQALLYDVLLPEPDSTIMAEAYFLLAKTSKTLSKSNYYYKSIVQLPENRYTKLAKLYYGKNLACQKNYEEAKLYFQDILSTSLSSCSAEANFSYAQICFQQEDYKEAITYYLNYLNLGKNTSKKITALFNIGNSYFTLKDYKSARNNYNRLLKYDLGENVHSYTLFKIAQTYENEKEFSKASEFYQKVTEQHPYSEQYKAAENRIIELAENGMSIEQPEQDTVKVVKTKKFFVQVAAYKNNDYAKDSRSKFADKDIHTIMYVKQVKGETYYCLGIGPYFSRQKAEVKKRELARQKINSFIYTKTDEQEKQ